MSNKTPEQKKARALQAETGWSYSECLRLVRLAFTDKITVDEVLKREGRTREP